MTTPKLSIIVPVYNVEKYLRRCIDSILAQTFTNFELLLIDDGSTDSSGAICDEYKDSRIRVFHKVNGGVSTARNHGLDNASGEWIYFMDGDDELIGEALETMMGETRPMIKMVVAGYERIEAKGIYSTIGKLDAGEHTFLDMLSLMFYGNHPYQGYLWNKMYKRDEIEKYGIRFNEQFYFNEDRLFSVEYLCKTKGDVYLIDILVYRYFTMDGGAMASLKRQFNWKFITDLYAFDKMLDMVISLNNHMIIQSAKKAMFGSYIRICEMMEKWDVSDTELKRTLHTMLRHHITPTLETYYWLRLYTYPHLKHAIKVAYIYCNNMTHKILPPPNK